MGKFGLFVTMALGLLSANGAAQALESVGPGHTLTLTTVDDGGKGCRAGVIQLPRCLRLRFLGTRSRPDIGRVRVRTSIPGNPGPNIGVPQYATAFVYKDISLAGPTHHLVPVQVSVTFDYRNLFVAAASYFVASSLSMKVIDLESGAVVAKHTLFEASQNGDQGLTDIAGTSQRQVLLDESASFSALLRRGRDYRLQFELENVSQVLVLGALENNARADWKSVTLRVDEDEFEELMAIKHLIRDEDDDD